MSRAGDDAERSDEEERRMIPAGDNERGSGGVGARPLAAARLGVPPPACGGEQRS
jgi:hypothetical protein